MQALLVRKIRVQHDSVFVRLPRGNQKCQDDDRRVTRRSNRECRDIATRTKIYYTNARRWPVDIRKILKSGKIQTLYGERPLIYEVVDDHLLGDKDATTELVNGAVKITAKHSVDQKAGWGDGRARMTLAHELGHGVMHSAEGVVDNRVTGAGGHHPTIKNSCSRVMQSISESFRFGVSD